MSNLTAQQRRAKTRRMALLALLIGVELVLFLTPLGYIPLGPINATTLHVPVIIAGLILGPKGGALLGLVFGLSSLVKNTFAPTITSFVFSPFHAGGNLASLWIVLGPRLILGILPPLLHSLFSRRFSEKVSTVLSSGLATLAHSFLVLASIYLFFGQAYAEASGVAQEALLGVIASVLAINGLGEIVIACLICPPVYLLFQKQQAR